MRATFSIVLLGLLSCGGQTPAREGAPTFAGAPLDVRPTDAGAFVVSAWVWPMPLARGVDAVRLEVADPAGNPVDGGAVVVTPWMPSHGHGTSVVPTITDEGAGAYDADPVLLFMGGRWELRTRIDVPGGATDTVVVPLDVP